MAGMRVLLGPLRQLNVEGKDIVSTLIKAAYESAPSRLSIHYYKEQVLPPKAVKESKRKFRATPNNKRRSTSPLKIEEPLKAKSVTRSTTKYNIPRQGLSYNFKTNKLEKD